MSEPMKLDQFTQITQNNQNLTYSCWYVGEGIGSVLFEIIYLYKSDQ